MSEWNPSIVKIEKIEKHPNADNLVIVTVLNDYPVITNMKDLNIGDLIGYIPIDTVVPDNEDFYFMCPFSYEQYEENGSIKNRQAGKKYEIGNVPEKYRIIKAKKIRDIYSMGLLHRMIGEFNEGDSIIDILSLKKWEELVDDEADFNNVKVRIKGRNAKSNPINFNIPYYDIEGLRKYLNLLNEDDDIVLLEKINGSNSSFVHDGNELWCKSRNFYKKDDPDDMWVDAANRYNLKEKLSKYPMKAFFAECCGQVKNFRYGTKIINNKLHTKLVFFDILDLNSHKFLDYEDSLSIINELELEYAPEIYKGKWLGKELMYPYAEGKTLIKDGTNIREGFVLKGLKEKYQSSLHGRFQFKLISQAYTLLK